MLLEETGKSISIAIYIMVMTVISVAAVFWVGETKGNNLHVEDIDPALQAAHDKEQNV